MIISQRKTHFRIWLLLAIALPLAVITAWVNIPDNQSDKFHRTTIEPYSNIVQSQQTDEIKVNLRENIEHKKQVELVILQPLVGASSQLFVSNFNKNPLQTQLGTLGSRGVYRFLLADSLSNTQPLIFTIQDVLKNQTVQTISFK